jgi:methionyl-tRNA synthetase
MKNTYYITTAIDYTNAAPHIGHAYEKVLADVMARFNRLKGGKVYFLTGVDQHGQKVKQAAEKQGVHPREFAEENTAKFLNLWSELGLSHDGWAATTDPRHGKAVQAILQSLHDKGALYKARHAGYYSVRQEQFLTDKERGPDGEFGPEWGEVVYLEEENWYFRLAEHKEWLLEFLRTHEDFVSVGMN